MELRYIPKPGEFFTVTKTSDDDESELGKILLVAGPYGPNYLDIREVELSLNPGLIDITSEFSPLSGDDVLNKLRTIYEERVSANRKLTALIKEGIANSTPPLESPAILLQHILVELRKLTVR